MYKIILLPEAKKFYKRLYFSDRSHFLRVNHAIESLQKDPFQGKPLKHKLKGRYSLRVGMYQIIYLVERQKVIVYVLDSIKCHGLCPWA